MTDRSISADRATFDDRRSEPSAERGTGRGRISKQASLDTAGSARPTRDARLPKD